MIKIALALLFFSGSVFAEITDNLITSPLSPTVNATAPGGYSGGSTPGYNSSTNTYYFGYTQSVLATTIAINNALQGSGVQVGGVQYGLQYLNGADSYGTLGLNVNVTSAAGIILHSYSHSFDTQNSAWQTFDQTQTFTNPYTLANLGNVSMSITGQDSRFWAGYYGPQVRNPYLRLTYTPETPVITTPTFYDDTYVSVPLQFGFPFYGRTFTNSWMHSNGVVSFLDPAVPIPLSNGSTVTNPGSWAYCCGDRPTGTKPEFSFIIAPLWTDLYPVASSTFSTEGTSTYQRYFWNNIGEISNQNNLNTFSLEIRPSGFIGVTYDKINIQNQNTWAGIVGDPALGQITERFYGIPGLNAHGIGLPNWSITDTPADQCTIDPLSSPTCPGYFTSQCTINPLYNSSCPGYASAYFNQQCSLNTLYDPACPGYAAAYLTYQCNNNALYSTTCPGYEEAYFNQQCSLNPLYSTRCSGYADAYYVQQCNLNPLYDVGCTGYAQAYFNQQCSLNGLYDRTCPNYAEAYAKKMILEQQNIASIVDTAGTVSKNSSESNNVNSDGVISSIPSSTGSSIADKALPGPATTTNTSAAPAAPVQLVQQPRMEQGAAQQQVQADKKPENKPDGPQQRPNQGNQTAEKSQPTNRQAIAERRMEAAKREAAERGKNLAAEVGKANDIEQQKQLQNVVIAAMGYNPGFDSYGKIFVPDSSGYRPFTIYNNQKTTDNARVGRGLFGPTNRLHNEILELQYNRGK